MAGRIERVVIMVQENHTTDNYFRGLAPYGGAVVSDWRLTPNPPANDPAHDRQAYFKWLTGASTGGCSSSGLLCQTMVSAGSLPALASVRNCDEATTLGEPFSCV